MINNPERIHFYYLHEPYGPYWDRIKPALTLVQVELDSKVEAFDYPDPQLPQYRYAHHADFIRLEKLIQHGGVYADMDTLFVSHFPDNFYNQPFVLGREKSRMDARTSSIQPALGNALIFSEPGAEFGRIWLEDMRAAFDGSWSNHSTYLPYRLAARYPDLLHIADPRAFYRFDATNEGLITLLEESSDDLEGVYSIHLWSHLWWSDMRVDFTSFHAGLLTPEYIEQQSSTYARIAAPFLPEQNRRERIAARLRTAIMRGKTSLGSSHRRLRIRAKVLLLPWVPTRLLPNKIGHLHYALRQRMAERVAADIDAQNAFEKAIINESAFWDRYQVVLRQFEAQDVIIDIGAHLGSFSAICHHRGSRRIHAFEASQKNFARLKRNMRTKPGVSVYHQAVFRSDLDTLPALNHSGFVGANSGSGNVMMDGAAININLQEVWPSELGESVTAISLDDILARFETVRLLKLDCEGSEYPILLTSKRLDQVQELVVEFHDLSDEIAGQLSQAALLPGFSHYEVSMLIGKLEGQDFVVRVEHLDAHIGILRALRP
jgi:FkbM family methyltransferase